MSYCSLSPFDSKSGDEFKTAIDNVNITCNKGVNSKNVSQTWKTFYIPMSSEVADKAAYVDTCDLLVAVDGKEYFKMTYKNIQRFATLEQSNAYHAFRKQHLCFVMSEAVKGTDFCYKMMGSNSSASDVDISVFSTALVPKRPSEDIKKIITTYNKLNADRFGKEDMADVFDANLYFTNFLQVFEVLDDDTLDMKFGNVKEKLVKYDTNANTNTVANTKVTNLKKEILNKMTSKRVGIDVGSVSTGCFGLVSNKKINARALYIPSVNNPMQRVYAMMRLAEYFAFNGDLLKSVVESGIAVSSSNSSVKDRFMKQLVDVFGKCKEVQNKVNELRVRSDEAYKGLMEDYFIQREHYILDGLHDQAVANDVINTLSLATFLEDEAYHSQGAFLHINAQKDWGFELNEDDYVDSIFENVGFMMEYSDPKRHVGMSPFGRYEKINKYYSRISDALAMIEKERVPCQGTSSVLFNVKRNTARTNQQDVLRKECSNDNTGEKELVYNKMINKMVTDFTQGIITLENVKQMTFDQLKMVVNSMLRRIFFYMMEMRLESYNFVAQGGARKGLKVMKDKQTSQASHQTLATPLNAALMIAPLLGGKRARKQTTKNVLKGI
jgi:hypothetical protein